MIHFFSQKTCNDVTDLCSLTSVFDNLLSSQFAVFMATETRALCTGLGSQTSDSINQAYVFESLAAIQT